MNNPTITHYPDSKCRSEVWRDDYEHHRADGPAVIWYRDDESVERKYWVIRNQYHRMDGPAIIWYHRDGSIDTTSWWIHGMQMDINEFLKEIEFDEMNEEAIILFGLKYS